MSLSFIQMKRESHKNKWFKAEGDFFKKKSLQPLLFRNEEESSFYI
ncbi:hypothetical protein NRS6167_13450 [Bacillus subtilis]|nr:hypothetical protein NRS6167_02080 [Bacillus subtilis]CAI6285005.1 hypothetical protein NRS6167_13450 [Bacillus subtilis]